MERKIIENVKKLKEERQIEELKKLQIEAGLIPASHMQRLDWIYQGPECNKDITTAEEVLIGKSLKDEKPEDKRYFTPVFQESYSNPQNEIFTKIHEDPLFLIKKEQLQKRKDIEDNPYKMKILLKKLEQEVLDKLNSKEPKKDKKSKKHKKDKKEKKRQRESERSPDRDSNKDRESSYEKSKSKKYDKDYERYNKHEKAKDKKNKKESKHRQRSRSSSISSSDSSSHKNKQSKKSSREIEDKYNLRLNEESRGNSHSKVKYSKLEDENKDFAKNKFGLITANKSEQASNNKNSSKGIGPDENLYKNRMELLQKEADLRKRKSR